MKKKRTVNGTRYKDARVQCPFYKSSTDNEILCEGAADRQTVTVRNRSRSEHRKYMARYCEEGYKECLYYRAANEKYEEEER